MKINVNVPTNYISDKNHPTLEELLVLNRIPPILWIIIGYMLSFLNLYYYDDILFRISIFLFLLYGCLNLFFNLMTFSFDFKSNNFLKYNEFNFLHKLTISNYQIEPSNIEKSGSIEEGKMTSSKYYFDDTKIFINITTCNIDSDFIKTILYFIYIFGITDKNYAHKKNIDYFKETIQQIY